MKRGSAPCWVVLCDVVLINASMFIAYWMRYELQWLRDVSEAHPLSSYIPWSIFLTLLMLLTLRLDRAYRDWRGRSWLDHMYRIVNAAAKSVVILFATTFALDIFLPVRYSRALFLEAGIAVALLLGLARIVQNRVESALRTRGIGATRIVIVGAGEVGRTIMRTVVAQPGLGYNVIGFVDDNPDKGQTDIGRFRALGSIDALPGLIEDLAVDEVIITLPWMYHRRIMSVVRECERRDVSARIVPDLFQMSLSQVSVGDIGGVPLVGVREVGFSRGALAAKRVVDLVGSSLMLVFGAPILGLIALLVWLDSGRPVVFRQTRVGTEGRLFEIYKFRTMQQGAEADQERLRDLDEIEGAMFKIRNDPRITRVGKLLRRTSLDELPQLLNVLRGEMSLVGPRPPTPNEVEHYEEWQKRRLQGRPGLTGLWQVSGRSLLSFDETALLDIFYIENWSLWLDFKIVLRTIPTVLLGDGAY
jgi:exopolysaccharide biosynthesis polyprenyl glycosylphosphotransferase